MKAKPLNEEAFLKDIASSGYVKEILTKSLENKEKYSRLVMEVESVSSDGMSRVMKVALIGDDNAIYPLGRVRCKGCGMDMLYYLAREIYEQLGLAVPHTPYQTL